MGRLCALLCLLLVTVTPVYGERPLTTTYGLADGLPSTFIDHIASDSRGLLWFSTRDGLARFDGSRFVTYGMEHGLPIPSVSFLLESRRVGGYWVATNGGGVCRMDSEAVHAPAPSEQPRKLFRCISLGQEAADHVNVLQEDAAGRIWIGTDGGLYRFDDGLAGTRPRFVDLRDPDAAKRPVWVSALLAGDADEMWVGTNLGLIRLLADGRALPYRVASTASPGEVRDIARGADGRVWVAYPRGLLLVRPVAAPDPLIRRSTMPADEQESRWIDLVEGEVGESALLVSVDGHAWIGTDRGLLEFDGQRFRRYGAAHGLPERLISELARDRDDNVWIAALSGVTKLSQHGFITYDKHDGLTPATIHSLFEDSSGHVFAVGDSWIVSRFDGTRFVSVRPRMAPATPGWAAQLALLDRGGAWWILGATGLARYPAAEGIDQIQDRPPPVVYASLGGAPGQGLFRLFEDARGDIWWGAAGETGGLGRWGRATNSFVRYPDAQGDVRGDKASAFGEDASGALWIGFYRGGLLRYDGGRFERLSGKDVPGGMITAIHRDSRGRLWIGSNRDGLTRVDDPTDGRRRFVRYTTADGLSSGNVRCVISDATDRIYVGTVRGVDRLDPPSGAIRRYTTADGLANGFVTAALRDSNGGLWFGTLDGLSRLVPRREGIPAPPSTWIEGWRINGVPQGVSHLGQALVSRVVLQPRQNQIQIEFYGVGFGRGGPLRYQYRLDGADRDWSRPTESRVVHYPHLAAGRYRFQVRAVNPDGLASVAPAAVEFTVLPPYSERWWFRAGIVLAVVLALFAAHRYRVARLLAVERVRTRIASDLHDDIGSSLSQIAILSEVVRTSAGDDARVAAPLSRIATLSRESVDAMGDIVWAIDPHRDTPTHLAQRLRRLASDLLPPRGIDLRFDIAGSHHPRLGADVRREVFLIVKEALHNVVRHSNATRVDIDLTLSEDHLQLVVQDNGRGFDSGSAPDGQGLRNMARRAQGLGGTLDVTSPEGSGTRVALTVPV